MLYYATLEAKQNENQQREGIFSPAGHNQRQSFDNHCGSLWYGEIEENSVHIENERDRELVLAQEKLEMVQNTVKTMARCEVMSSTDVDDNVSMKDHIVPSLEDTEDTDDWIVDKVLTSRHEIHFDDNDNGTAVDQVVPNIDEKAFGDVSINNSEHVYVGNHNFYAGPVTIKQFIYTNTHMTQNIGNGTLLDHIKNSNQSGQMPGNNTDDLSQSDISSKRLRGYRSYKKVTTWVRTKRFTAILWILALSVVISVVLVSVFLTSMNSDILEDSVNFISRKRWISRPLKKPVPRLQEIPAPYVTIGHTVQTPCNNEGECAWRVREAQNFHTDSRGWDDLGSNFYIGGDGQAYVGRDWDYENVYGPDYKNKSISISLIGDFTNIAPPKKQLHATLKVIEFGLKSGKITLEYKLLGHRQIENTMSPGEELYKIIKTWDHWSPDPKPKNEKNRATSISRPALIPFFCLSFYSRFFV